MLIFLATSADVLVSVPDAGPGNWAGGACVLVDGIFWLAYRIRRPLNSGRGVGVVVAKSGDGVNFKPVCEVSRDAFDASLEHPVILPADVGWRRISVERPRTPLDFPAIYPATRDILHRLASIQHTFLELHTA